jgi:hypothetical protein
MEAIKMAEPRQTSKVHRSREEAEDAIRETSAQATQLSHELLHAGEHAAHEGIGLLQANADLVRHTTEIWLTLMTQMAEHNTKEYVRLFGGSGRSAQHMAQQSSRATRDAKGTVSGVSGTLSDMSKEWINFIQKRAQRNADHWNSLINCRTPQDIMVAQSALFRENFEELVESWRRIAEGSLRLREEAGREISEKLEHSSSAA